MAIEQKAAEIKGVHAMLTDYELKEKPVRARKEKYQNIVGGNKETAKKLRDILESEMNRLKTLF